MSERFLRRFHAAHPGITSRVLARGGSYQRLAARVPARARVLDLGCGDGHLMSLLGPGAVGLDISADELRGHAGARVQGRAQALPFADRAFDVVVSHLAFMLMAEPERVVAELDRVLAAGGTFHAVLGGGPTADGADAFHRFLALARPRRVVLGDLRARSEPGWRALFAGWNVTFERWAIDLSGPFEDVWAFFASSYELFEVDTAAIRAALAAELRGVVPCTAVMWLASATR